MMNDLETRIKTLAEVAEKWLSDDNEYLLRSVHQTVEEGYFSFGDVQFALKTLKQSLSKEKLQQWVKTSGISDQHDAGGKNVLCLHAGNLPLVGFQSALAVLLSGARYTGKISRKDPYLLPTFLNEVKKTEVWGGVDVQWSHRLDDFEDMQNDAVLFAGSEESVPGVREAIEKYNLKKPGTKYLIRTAHFSMAYLPEKDERLFKELSEAILRYGGKGCRSVAVVVAPFAFDEVQDELYRHCGNFLEENPQHNKPEPKLCQRYAYNQAIERRQLWLEDFLLQERGLELDQDFICYWVQGDASSAATWAEKFGDQLQSVYVPDETYSIVGQKNKSELLAEAQQPPIDWKPDGVDILKWLSR